MTVDAALKFLRALPETTVQDHWGSDAFKAHGRIFATVWHDKNQVNLRLSIDEQERFVKQDADAIVPIDNAWGRQGWTTVRLEACSKKLFEQAAKAAFTLSVFKNANAPVAKPEKRPRARKK
jgi:hypothetical protein